MALDGRRRPPEENNAPGGNEAQCTGQGAEASAPNRQMIVSGKGPNAGPQIFPFEL